MERLLRSAITAHCLCLGLIASACGEEFAPSYIIENPRALGLTADTGAVHPGQEVVVRPVLATTNGLVNNTDVDIVYWECPPTRRNLLDPQPTCENRRVLGSGSELIWRASDGLFPEELLSGSPTDSDFSDTEKWFASILGHRAAIGFTATFSDGTSRDAFRRIPIFPRAQISEVRPGLASIDVERDDDGLIRGNQNPILNDVTAIRDDVPFDFINDTFGPGQTLRLAPNYDGTSLEGYTSLMADMRGIDIESETAFTEITDAEILERFVPIEHCEVPTFHWYVTGGILKRDVTTDGMVVPNHFLPRNIGCVERPEAREPSVEFVLPEGGVDASLVRGIVVMRDGRGGISTQEFSIAVTR